MSDKELWELISIISEGQDSEQKRKVEQYITGLQKEIERLTISLQAQEELTINEYVKEKRLNKGIEKLHSIIKEVREYIEERYIVKKEENIYMTEDTKGLLEILDKESEVN